MTEIDAAAAYEAVLAEIQGQLPDLYAQVVAEVDRGRELKASEISRNDKATRDRELISQRLGRLSDADLAAVELTPEERLMVLVRAIAVATETYNASTEALSRFASEAGADRIRFINPGEDGPSEDVAADDGRVEEASVDGRSGASIFAVSGETSTIDREAIDAVLEALDGIDEHN